MLTERQVNRLLGGNGVDPLGESSMGSYIPQLPAYIAQLPAALQALEADGDVPARVGRRAYARSALRRWCVPQATLLASCVGCTAPWTSEQSRRTPCLILVVIVRMQAWCPPECRGRHECRGHFKSSDNF